MQIGTLWWTLEDDQGRQHSFDIPISYYVPDGKLHPLSSQHWSQSQSRNRKQRARCGETRNGNEFVLLWNDGDHKLHIELGRDNNVATFPLVHGLYTKFEAFCCKASLNDPSSDPIAMPSSIISDDEDNHNEVLTATPQQWKSTWQQQATPTDAGPLPHRSDNI